MGREMAPNLVSHNTETSGSSNFFRCIVHVSIFDLWWT
ncbi:hypothetical protein CIPAW_05G072700 [Carya illinoinensis]|uniref:Uncharacterized protein n=1 Tax=Carya illinoinensis TaxID=32201 RepID=A0A8T1QG26_CARIL|nr:hypothetical protein CIPAW_05G072700 [Carya illinoinensis]